ncbi:PIG-L family deacetylase [Oleiagrimonas sp. C23AA]|uniref:PIG-L deacetylase family protein n=1 Tax=Oleiagrimonas sp. C23AA TaxID=2719047 RepID=UPI001423A97A|nr:PIG-L family deacetylase [Oleiagrimonas sp. C23AA]NII10326.1 PIG-L family deacetylase [Oleiagrimonas sp. C23AA]
MPVTQPVGAMLDPADLVGKRLLVVAPHPDDESLAAGGLLATLAGRAEIWLLQVTDGDDNPWPQRILERRWRLRAGDRQRWAARRRGELTAAVGVLGIDPAHHRRLGWPDMGVGERALHLPQDSVNEFARVLGEVAPDVLVLPTLDDAHPDHSACHVLVQLALVALESSPHLLGYVVHARHDAGQSLVYKLSLDDRQQALKRRAVLCHTSQVALSRRRLLRLVGPDECYQSVDPAPAGTQAARWLLAFSPPRCLQALLQLQVLHADGSACWRFDRAPLERVGTGWQLCMPARGPVFARLTLRWRTLWIFDHWGWHGLTPAASVHEARSSKGEMT